MSEQGVGVHNLRTPYGELSYVLKRDGRRIVLRIEGGLQPPPGGLVFRWPYESAPGSALLNGKPVRWEGKELRVRRLPAVIEMAGAAR